MPGSSEVAPHDYREHRQPGGITRWLDDSIHLSQWYRAPLHEKPASEIEVEAHEQGQSAVRERRQWFLR